MKKSLHSFLSYWKQAMGKELLVGFLICAIQGGIVDGSTSQDDNQVTQRSQEDFHLVCTPSHRLL